METKSKTSQLKTGATETSGHAYFFRSKSLIVATVSVTTALAITYVCYLKINDQAPKNQLNKFSNSGATAFVKPPLTKKNIPFEKFTINAGEQCKVINTNHTQISIPANAFIHADGTAVTGTVEVRYREMNDAVDFFLCGIPMTYDSGGTQYTFQSAGMCEILCFEQQQPIYIGPHKSIEIKMVSEQPEPIYNLYFLDTVNKKWEFLNNELPVSIMPSDSASDKINGELLIKQNENNSVNQLVPEKDYESAKAERIKTELQKPALPKMVKHDRSLFTLKVDSLEFPEIAIYKNIFFEMGEENTNFSNDAYNITYDDVLLKENKKGDNYLLTLKKKKQSFSFIVYPVFKGKDYDVALETYNQKTNEYNTLLKQRIEREASAKLDYEKAVAQRQAAIQKQYDYYKNEYDSIQQRYYALKNSAQTVIRSFNIYRLGTYNCDRPVQNYTPQKFTASFTDEQGAPLHLETVYLYEAGRNAIFTFEGKSYFVLNYNPEALNMIWGVTTDNKLAFLSYREFKKYNRLSGYCVIKMDLENIESKSDEEIRELLKI